jgi:hypothetical protein
MCMYVCVCVCVCACVFVSTTAPTDFAHRKLCQSNVKIFYKMLEILKFILMCVHLAHLQNIT